MGPGSRAWGLGFILQGLGPARPEPALRVSCFVEDDALRLRIHEERRCSILGPTHSRISPIILEYAKSTAEQECRVIHTNSMFLFVSTPRDIHQHFSFVFSIRSRENMTRIRQSRPDRGLGFQLQAPETLLVVPSSLGSSFRVFVL